jgi:hypothetical protein
MQSKIIVTLTEGFATLAHLTNTAMNWSGHTPMTAHKHIRLGKAVSYVYTRHHIAPEVQRLAWASACFMNAHSFSLIWIFGGLGWPGLATPLALSQAWPLQAYNYTLVCIRVLEFY